MSALRILHVLPYYADAWAYGGVPRAAAALCEALARRGHDVTVCTTDACDGTRRLRHGLHVRRGVRVHVFPNRSNRLAYRWQAFAPIGLATFVRANVRQFDLVHIHAHRHLPEVHAARACRSAGVPYVLTPNGTGPRLERRLAAKAVFDAVAGHRILRHAACITTVSEAEARQLRAFGVDGRSLRRLANPVDLSEFCGGVGSNPPALGRARPLIAFLGQLLPRKGVDSLVRALTRLEAPASLAIAGNDQGSESRVRRLVRKLNLESRVRFLGLLRGQARLALLRSADLVVYPSRDEVFGLVAAEALLCGTPVIVGNDCGCGEIVREVGGGLTVEPMNDRALASTIDRMLQAPAYWREAARSAGCRLGKLVDPDRVAERALAIYGEAIGRRVQRHA